MQSADAQTPPSVSSLQPGVPQPLTLPPETNGDVPSGDRTTPPSASSELPRAPLQRIDPVTGRPVDGNAQSTDFIDRQRQREAGPGLQGAGPPPVPAYIALPTMVLDPFTLPAARLTDRAVNARTLPGSTVLQARRPEYDAPGVRLGGILVHPYLSAAANGDSNVYAQNNGQADAFFSGTAGFAAASDWGRHALSANGFVQRRQYARFRSENSTSYQAAGSGRYDLSSHSSITASAITQQVVVSRSAVEELLTQAEPIQYQQSGGKLAAAVDYGRIEIGATGGYARTHYDNNRTGTGQPLSESYRTHNSATGQVTLAYDLPDQSAVYGEFDYEHRTFAAAGRHNNADVYSALGGLRGGITRLIRGHIAVGYLRVAFVDPTVHDIGSPTVDADLDWLVSRRTTVSLRANRILRTVSQGNSHGALITSLSLTGYHEARRNVILSASVQQSWSNYINSDERADLTGLTLGADWLLDHHWRIEPQLNLSYRTTKYVEIDANSFDAKPFDALAGVGLSYRF